MVPERADMPWLAYRADDHGSRSLAGDANEPLSAVGDNGGPPSVLQVAGLFPSWAAPGNVRVAA